MTGKEFAQRAKEVQRMKTLYAKGAFGAPLNEKNKIRYKVDRDVEPDRFMFDCCGLWHAILAGFSGDSTKSYGGTVVNQEQGGISYGEHHIPDLGADGCFSKGYLKDISNDMNNIQVGEILWTVGHNGIYVGNGYAIECTPRGEGGVQISQFKDKKAFNYREWLQHGKIPFLIYEDTDSVSIPVSGGVKSITCPCCGNVFLLKEV